MTRRRHQRRQEFWNELSQKLEEESDVLPSSFDIKDSEGPEKDNWRSWRILPANAVLGISVHLQDYIYVYLYLGRSKTEDMFEYLRSRWDEIEAVFQSPLRYRPTGSGAQIKGKDKILLVYEADILEHPEKWDEYQTWLIQSAERFYGVFLPHLQAYENQK